MIENKKSFEPPEIGGYKILTDPNKLDVIHYTWKQRWFSWPWKPWIKTKYVPNKDFHIFGDEYIVCHPKYEKALIESLTQKR